METPFRVFFLLLACSLGCVARSGSPSGGGGGDDAAMVTDRPSVVDSPVADLGIDAGSPAIDAGSTDTGADIGAPGDVCRPTGEEFSETQCSDGVDNNCDGRIDCMDVGCAWRCGQDAGIADGCARTGPENTSAACTDGRDNDCDGYLDCVDFDCSRNPAVTVCAVDAGAPDVGFPRDSGNTRDVTRIDTAGCVPMGLENSTATCTDGRDNDCDGFVDCQDQNCSCQASCGPYALACVCRGSESTNALCTDRTDNDCDSFVDCNDFDCTRTAAVTVCALDAGLRDAGPADVFVPRDSGNTRDAVRIDTAGCVSTGSENTTAACTDGRDNDCDGFVDCHDQNCSCQASCGPFARDCACRGPENTNAVCADRFDNDCNGFLDCADFACSRNTMVTVCP